jgi:hypothetical protein
MVCHDAERSLRVMTDHLSIAVGLRKVAVTLDAMAGIFSLAYTLDNGRYCC